MIRSFALAAFALCTSVSATAQVTIGDGTTKPESLTVTAQGDIIAGSSSAPKIHIVRKGAKATETLVDLGAEGGLFLGVLADAASGTLWACHLTPGASGPRSNLRGFDLKTGAQKLRWELPGAAVCNDFAVGPDRALYIADTIGKLYRLPAGTKTAELLFEGPLVAGADGITFLSGVLFVNNITSGKVYRVPLDAAGKATEMVEIKLDGALSRPDGMRAAKGKLFVAEGGGGRVVSLTVTADTAHIAVVKDGLKQPTSVEPMGDVLWFNELPTGQISSVPIPK